MDDLISRKALMKKIAHHTVHDSMSCVTFERSTVYEMVKGDMFGLVKDAPAVASIPRWISVEERLPEEEVLAANFTSSEYGYKECIIGYVSPPSPTMPDGYYAENEFEILQGVTHWMPIPQPPKEE